MLQKILVEFNKCNSNTKLEYFENVSLQTLTGFFHFLAQVQWIIWEYDR